MIPTIESIIAELMSGTMARGQAYAYLMEHMKLASTETLRDVFAAAAISGVVAVCGGDTRNDGETTEDYFARKAYGIADAMVRFAALKAPDA